MPNHAWSLHGHHLPHVHLHNPFHPGRITVGLLIMTVVQVIFGGYSYLTSRALKSCTVKPVIFAFVRDLGGALILITLAYTMHARKVRHANSHPASAPLTTRFWIARQDLGTFALAGLLGVYGAQCLSAATIGVTSGLFFSLWTPLTPCLTMVWCLMLKQERFSSKSPLSWLKLAGILIAVGGGIGIAVSSASGSALFSSAKNLGLGFFLLCLQLLSASSYSVVQKPLLSRYAPVTVAAWTYVLGTLFISLGIIDDTNGKAEDWDFSALAGWAVAYAILFSSVIAYSLIAVVVKLCSPVIVTASYPIQAIVTALLSWGIDGLVPPPGTIASAVLIAAGLVVMVLAKHKEELQAHAVRKAVEGFASTCPAPEGACGAGSGAPTPSGGSPSDAVTPATLAKEPDAAVAKPLLKPAGSGAGDAATTVLVAEPSPVGDGLVASGSGASSK